MAAVLMGRMQLQVPTLKDAGKRWVMSHHVKDPLLGAVQMV
jgi:hypothetical protein